MRTYPSLRRDPRWVDKVISRATKVITDELAGLLIDVEQVGRVVTSQSEVSAIGGDSYCMVRRCDRRKLCGALVKKRRNAPAPAKVAALAMESPRRMREAAIVVCPDGERRSRSGWCRPRPALLIPSPSPCPALAWQRRGENPRPSYQSITALPDKRFSPAVPMRDFMPLALVVDLAWRDCLVRCAWLCNKTILSRE